MLRFDEDLRKSGRNSAELYNNCSLRYNSNVKLRNGGMKEMTIITEKKIGRNEPCWCGSGEKYKNCHYDFDRKIDSFRDRGIEVPTRDMIKTPEQIEGIRKSGQANIAVLDYVAEHIDIGMTTEEIDRLVFTKTTELGGIPAPLDFEGFPKSVCTSVNDQVCHGIPTETVTLKAGDIINVDVSTILDGYFSDSSRMFCMGEIDDEKRRLVDCVYEAIRLGLEQVRPWHCLGDMGQAINDYAKSCGFSVVEEVGGHGVGLEFHEDPWVSYVSNKGEEMLMVPGMVFTVEPMINAGGPDIFVDSANDWTIYTTDGKPSAQAEVQVVVTEDGYEILAH